MGLLFSISKQILLLEYSRLFLVMVILIIENRMT